MDTPNRHTTGRSGERAGRRPVRRWRKPTAILLTLTLLIGGLVATAPTPADAVEPGAYVLYDDEIRNDFDNWSWAVVDTEHTETVASGDYAVSVDAGPWEAFFLGKITNDPLPLYGTLRFELHGGTSDSTIGVRMLSRTGESESIPITPTAGSWQSVTIDLAEFGGFSSFSGVWFDNLDENPRPTYYVDDVRVVAGDAPPAAAGPELRVDLGSRTLTRTVTDPASGVVSNQVIAFPHPISEGIYGMNFASNAVREELGVTVNRWGGNSTERFNHEIATTNAAADWYFMNNPDEMGADHTFENENQADGTETIMTLPMLGWVAKNREANCSYPTVDVLGPGTNAGPQDGQEPHWLNPQLLCGNGTVGGTPLGGADPTITSRAADENFAADWVRHLVATHGDAASGGVETYALGNEPGLWYSTHEDVRPDPLGRTELIDRNRTWATAVKDADPTANVIGPVLWSGYSYYVTTEEILRGDRPGDVPTFVEDYLKAMRQAGEAAGTRLLDSLAVNFYDDRVYGTGSDDLRLESTRQLWDPTYAPQDWWVARDFLNGDGSAVIPRLNSLIDRHYPGTDLAITEYNFGGNDTVAGGLAQADVLGIFGREGLDVATVWDPFLSWVNMTEDEWGARPLIDAFRLYRNYDGQGGRFGDVANFSESSDEARVAVHAGTRTADGALTVVVINKTRDSYVSPIDLDGRSGVAERWDYSAATNGVIERGGDITVTDGMADLVLAPRSATVLVLSSNGDPDPEPEPDP
ncbi:MAG: glycoside hydrolase family 44 protein, partial [Actinomycetota bacterium]